MSAARIGSAEVSVGGRSYLANIYSITGAATITYRDRATGGVQSIQVQFSGVITLVNGSNILYRAEGQVTGSSGRSVRFSISLVDTNLDLLANPTNYSTTSLTELAPAVMSLPSDGLGLQASLYGQAERVQAAQVADDYSGRALVVVTIGLAGLAVAAAVPLRRRTGRTEDLGRKPHYV